MNSERFEERLMHELKDHVRQRAEPAGMRATADARPVTSRRVRWVLVAVAGGMAAAVAGTTLTLAPSRPNTEAGPASSSPDGRTVGRIANVAYTVEQQGTGKVKLTIEDPSRRPDAEALSRDLARVGVRAKVLLGDSDCPFSGPFAGASQTPEATTSARPESEAAEDTRGRASSYITEENGKIVAYVDPATVPTGGTLVIGFPAAHTRRPLGSMTITDAPDDGPGCIASAPTDGTRSFLHQ
ncbi:hypothetical protein [Streptomyces chromofuscus]|uniref:Uncharacterized protein n=1 Tax=Streptomyces chromofuscus TaxID=42881 RepID=A0A7M2T9I0_STRCW|nr:hypothetical protein [Streptomyces chromofuscus]QOV44595.1 hypothetical protein IPT68_00660 [Streptomyces chromofuscus]GGT01984.1 hypothetical protein GCM10010254_22950 [Streptomyces chromofuscus]